MRNNEKRVRSLLIFILCLACVAVLYIIGKPASYLWVMDRGDLKNKFYLVKMCPTGKPLLRIQFGQSEAIGFDPRENIVWATEMGDVDNIHYDQVVKVDSQGNVIDRFQGYGSPVLAVDPNDGSVWVSMWNASEARALLTKIASNGKLIRKVDGFYMLYSIALDPRDGSIWAADGGNRILMHISANGEKLFEMPFVAFFSGSPHQISIDPNNGNVWFTSTDKVYKISPHGQILAKRDGFNHAVAIALDPVTEQVWVANFGSPGEEFAKSGTVAKLDSNGNVMLTLDMQSRAYMLGINPFDETVWVGIDEKIIRYDKNGTIVGWQPGFNKPQSIVLARTKNDLLTEIRCTISFYADRFSNGRTDTLP
jgi:DNA-binding beta-propeller fold protein YncE